MPKAVSRETVEVRKTVWDNGSVSYDGDHDGEPWRMVWHTNGWVRVHFPHGFMRVVHTMYGKKRGWTNIDVEPLQQ